MLSEETLKILVPLFTAILGIFVGYFLNQALYEKKRKDDLADRDFNRRATIYDMRIKEAREYVDAYYDILRRINIYEEELIEQAKIPTNLGTFLRQNHKKYDEIPDLMQELSKKMQSLYILDDTELKDLFQEVTLTLLLEVDNIKRIEGTISATEIFDEKAESDRAILFSAMTTRLITKMQQRLDKLSQTIK